MKCIRNENNLVVVLDNGVILQDSNCDDYLFDEVINASCDEEVISILNPVSKEVREEIRENTQLLADVSESKYLVQKGDSVYWPGVSPLSMPKELVNRVIEAENGGDEDAIEAYHNFWVLLSLNPDPICRENLFWFLEKWGFTISKTGLFVAYRNVDTYDTGDYETVYTDHHSHSFRIRIGEMVTMPREKCDCSSENSCSRGLHLGGTTWLDRHYFGDTGIVCLCNPVDVVAVPHMDDYGKLRTCAYLPIAVAKYGEDDKIIPYNIKDGFEAPYVKTVLYDGIISAEESPKYTIEIPELPEISRESVTKKVLEIARTFMK